MACNKFLTFETAWCPGCGDLVILEALKDALNQLDKEPHQVLVVGGIGQAAKTPQYINTNGFCGLHGRAVPPAVAAKIANKDLTVIIDSGDGDTYGEGGNHFIHNIRRNVDIAHFVHDNQIYGLTKGQASPTTDAGHVTPVQPLGSMNIPMNPLAIALVLGAGFVARTFSGDKEHMTKVMMQAIQYKGYALVDILQPCVSFNKINTFQWYNKRIYKLDETYDSSNRSIALEKSMEWGDRIPIGVLYNQEFETYHDKLSFLRDEEALIHQTVDLNQVNRFIQEFE